MRIIRIFFKKTGEASYISHLDLQRVMARSLRKSNLPVWYSQGFNPHIYMSFALPLPLMQESLVETMDCKTEAEQDDFSMYITPLNDALPKGLVVEKIGFPVYVAADIESARYKITYGGVTPEIVAKSVKSYNTLQIATAIRKTKRSESEVNLRELISDLIVADRQPAFEAVFPAGAQLNLNPELLTNFLQEHFNLPASKANILRQNVFIEDGKEFC